MLPGIFVPYSGLFQGKTSNSVERLFLTFPFPWIMIPLWRTSVLFLWKRKRRREQHPRRRGGGGWIRTTEAKRNRFTVCPLWPLGNSSEYEIVWSWWTDSNPRPADYKSAALPAELHQHRPLSNSKQYSTRETPVCQGRSALFLKNLRFLFARPGLRRKGGCPPPFHIRQHRREKL